MRILKANNEVLDIDDNTAIGIDIQAYDFKSAGDIKVNVSNSFTIPATSKNMRIFGFAGRAYSYNRITYGKILIDYYVNNEQYITSGVARVERVGGGRIHLFVAERPSFIDEMKEIPLNDFLKSWFDNKFTNDSHSDFAAFLEHYRFGHNGVLLPFKIGNLSKRIGSEGNSVEKVGYFQGSSRQNVLTLQMQANDWNQISLGGHFNVYLEPLLKYIETFFSVDLKSSSLDSYIIYNDSIISELSIPVRNITYKESNHSLEFIDKFADEIPFGKKYDFAPLDKVKPFDSLTVHDLFTATLKILGYAMEPTENGSFEIVRLDLIDQIGSPVGDHLVGYMARGFIDFDFIPNIEGYAINNHIKMKPFSGGGDYLGAKTGISDNKNLDKDKDLFKVDAYIPPFFRYDNIFIPDMSNADSFKTITFFKDTTTKLLTNVIGNYIIADPTFPLPSIMEVANLIVPEVYTVANEYVFLDDILKNPETRIIKRWVNSSMLKGFRKLAPYYVREFGSWYFVNKISNFNPEKSLQPVEFELIRLPWVRTPSIPEKEIDSTDEWIMANGYWDDSGIWIDSETWNDNI